MYKEHTLTIENLLDDSRLVSYHPNDDWGMRLMCGTIACTVGNRAVNSGDSDLAIIVGGADDEDSMLDRILAALNEDALISNQGCLVYRGGHHIAVCQGRRRIVVITAR